MIFEQKSISGGREFQEEEKTRAKVRGTRLPGVFGALKKAGVAGIV